MPKTNQNATIYRGEDVTLEFDCTNEDGTDFDFTDKEVHYRAALTAAGATKVAITEPDITFTGRTAKVPMTSARSKLLPAGAAYHELYVLEAGVKRILALGTLTVTAAQVARHT